MSADPQQEVIAFLSQPEVDGVALGPAGRDPCLDRVPGRRLRLQAQEAVRFSYLDYSTPELRRGGLRQGAGAELSDGSRISIYGLCRCWTASGGLTLGGGRHYRRPLPVRCCGSTRPGSSTGWPGHGQLTAHMMLQLADRIADFHQSLPEEDEHGGPAAIAEIIVENDGNLACWTGLFDPSAISRPTMRFRWKGVPAREVAAPAPEIWACPPGPWHLHLGNIALWRGTPMLFDAIEFSERLACVDILYDLSFLLMDLLERSQRDLAGVVFNRYFDRMPDEAEGAALLPLFLSIHASIRAHVQATIAGGATEAAARLEARRRATSYFTLAEDRLRPARRASWRSAVSRHRQVDAGGPSRPHVGQPLGARILRSDVIRKRLHGVAPEDRLPESAYTLTQDRPRPRCAVPRADQLPAAGCTVIADATFLAPSERAAIQAVADRRQVPFARILLDAPDAVLASRLSARTGDASDATSAVLKSQRSDAATFDWASFAADIPASTLVFRTLRYLGRLLAGRTSGGPATGRGQRRLTPNNQEEPPWRPMIIRAAADRQSMPNPRPYPHGAGAHAGRSRGCLDCGYGADRSARSAMVISMPRPGGPAGANAASAGSGPAPTRSMAA